MSNGTRDDDNCTGLCVTRNEIGIPGPGIAYPYPGCPAHDPYPDGCSCLELDGGTRSADPDCPAHGQEATPGELSRDQAMGLMSASGYSNPGAVLDACSRSGEPHGIAVSTLDGDGWLRFRRFDATGAARYTWQPSGERKP